MSELEKKVRELDTEQLNNLKIKLDAEAERRGIKPNKLCLPTTGTGNSDHDGPYAARYREAGIDFNVGKALHLAYKLKQTGNPAYFNQMIELGVNKAQMQEDTDSEGGYSVPLGYFPEVLRIRNMGNVEPLCRHIPMDTKTVTFPNLNSDISVGWVAEEGGIGESEPTLSQVSLTAKKLAAYSKITNELLADARPSVLQWLNDLFTEAMSREVDNVILNGTGDPCSGVLTAVCGYSVITTGTNFSSVTGTDLSEMISKLKASVLDGAVFVMNPKVFHFVRTLKDTTNNFIYSPIGGGQSGTIFGYRVVLCDSAPSATAANTPYIVFGNFNYFLFGDRMSLTMQIDPYSLFTTDASQVRWIRRIAPKVGRADAFCRLLTHA